MNNKKKAIIISCFDWYERRLNIISNQLSSDYEVDYFTSDYDHIKKEYYKERKNNCNYIHVPKYRKNISLKRVYSHYVFSKKIIKILKLKKYDLVYVLFPPNFLSKYLHKYHRNNCVCVVDLIDMWPESMPINILKNGIIGKIWKKNRNIFLSEADIIVTECNLYKNALMNMNIEESKINTLYLYKRKLYENYDDLLKFSCNHFLIQNMINFAYIGSINNIIDIDSIIEILLGYKKYDYLVKIKIIGDGNSKNYFLKKLEENGIEYEFYGVVFDNEKKMEIIKDCNFGLNVMKKNLAIGLSMKSIDYFSFGLPIINTVQGDTYKFVDDYKIGYNFTGEITIIDKEIHAEMIKNTCKIFNDYFSENAFIKKTNDLLDKIRRLK